jgi:hypothetical protein
VRGWIAILLTLALSSCAGRPLSNTEIEKNRRSFAQHLMVKDLAHAGVFARYFSRPVGIDFENLAQYSLLRCQPKAALGYIDRILNLKRKQFFQAVLLALVSVDRESDQDPKDLEVKATLASASHSKVSPRLQRVYPVQSDEIWADEWSNLEFSGSCNKMAVIADVKLRDKYKALSLELFKKIPQEWITSDFGAVSLAMDVGMQFEHPEQIAARFESEASNPYYRRLKGQVPDAGVARTFEEQNRVGIEITLSALDLSVVEYVPHAVKIPILISELAK